MNTYLTKKFKFKVNNTNKWVSADENQATIYDTFKDYWANSAYSLVVSFNRDIPLSPCEFVGTTAYDISNLLGLFRSNKMFVLNWDGNNASGKWIVDNNGKNSDCVAMTYDYEANTFTYNIEYLVNKKKIDNPTESSNYTTYELTISIVDYISSTKDLEERIEALEGTVENHTTQITTIQNELLKIDTLVYTQDVSMTCDGASNRYIRDDGTTWIDDSTFSSYLSNSNLYCRVEITSGTLRLLASDGTQYNATVITPLVFDCYYNLADRIFIGQFRIDSTYPNGIISMDISTQTALGTDHAVFSFSTMSMSDGSTIYGGSAASGSGSSSTIVATFKFYRKATL